MRRTKPIKYHYRKQVILFHLIVSLVLLFGACRKEKKAGQTEKKTNRSGEQVDSNSVRELLLNQPDFTAEEIVSEFESKGGYSNAMKAAKKGEYYRRETEVMVTFYKLGQPVICYWRPARIFQPVPKSVIAPDWYQQADNPEIFARTEGVTFQEDGTEVIDGHECVRVKATRQGSASTSKEAKEIVFLDAAKDLGNLVIKTEVVLSDRRRISFLRNISFDVPDALFNVLARYKPGKS